MTKTAPELPDHLLSALLNSPYEEMIVIDADGIIRFLSRGHERLYNLPRKKIIGSHISEINPKSKLHRVLETKKAEIGRAMILGGRSRIISRTPLKKDGRIIGAVGKMIFNDPEKIRELYGRIETLEKNLDYYKEELEQLYGIRYTFDEIIGESDPIQQVKSLAMQAAENNSPVIITGESGTGKELFAHAIHRAGNRHRQNFVRVNCAAVPHDLIEAEMFGYEPGSFTGANPKGKPGKFELAHKGTIFLDEIGDMPINMQVKMMRVLQEKEVERLGSASTQKIDFRVISATNQDLEDMIEKRVFRLDLYYRLNVIHISLPPLREIRSDIPLIFNSILKKLVSEKKRPVPTVAPEVMEALMQYEWAGNVRELRNVAERALIIHRKNHIELGDLPIPIQISGSLPRPNGSTASSLKSIVHAAEKKAIVRALEQSGNNKVRAAGILGIHRTALYKKMRRYNL